MNTLNYQDVANGHSPSIARYVYNHLHENLQEQFMFKGVDADIVEQLIEEWIAL